MSSAAILTKAQPTFYFVGVTTAQSSIMQIFPLWMQALHRPELAIEGVDCRIHDDPARYRAVVSQIKDDPLSLGGLVTTHKLDLLAAARDLFDWIDPYAELTNEISSISKADGRLEGHAKDPISAGSTIRAMLGDGYFGRTNADVLCFGAGGSGTAIALHMLNQADRPRRFIVTDISQERLDSLRQMVEQHGTDIDFIYHCNADPRYNDALLSELAPASFIINATGMGKDTLGSPLTDDGQFPQRGVVWELNYRGALDFLHQARARQTERALQVEDGWLYFLFGWTQVIAQVLHTPIEGATFDQLALIAGRVTGRL